MSDEIEITFTMDTAALDRELHHQECERHGAPLCPLGETQPPGTFDALAERLKAVGNAEGRHVMVVDLKPNPGLTGEGFPPHVVLSERQLDEFNRHLAPLYRIINTECSHRHTEHMLGGAQWCRDCGAISPDGPRGTYMRPGEKS